MDNATRGHDQSTEETGGVSHILGGGPAPAPAPVSAPVAAGCPTCGGGSPNGFGAASFVYALGRVEPRFPRLSVEKEFAQAAARIDTAKLTNRQTLHAVLSRRENRYLARQLCWVFAVEGLETYLLVPRDPGDVDLLIDSVRAAPSPLDLDLVVGVRGQLAPPELCNGLVVPMVIVDQMYSFDRDSLMKAIPSPKGMSAKEFTPAAEELFTRIMQMADNAGASDEDRALNYLAVRYPAIYTTAAEAHWRNASLSAVDVRPSPLSGTRRIVEVIFSFRNRQSDALEKFSTRVDVTEEFPFLLTKMSPYYDR